MWLPARKINQVNSSSLNSDGFNCNFLFYPVHSRQRMWLGHIPGTEKPQHLLLLPTENAKASSGWVGGKSDRKGTIQDTIQTQDLTPALRLTWRPPLLCLQPPLHVPHLLWP